MVPTVDSKLRLAHESSRLGLTIGVSWIDEGKTTTPNPSLSVYYPDYHGIHERHISARLQRR